MIPPWIFQTAEAENTILGFLHFSMACSSSKDGGISMYRENREKSEVP
jgi:hypothetical protein